MTATVLLGSILATVSVVDGSSRALLAAERRAAATNVATSTMEGLRAVPIEHLALRSGPQRFEDREVLRSPRGWVVHDSTEEVDGRKFRVQRWVTAEETEVDGVRRSGMLRRLTVVVSWDGGRVRLDSAVAIPAPNQCERPWVDLVAGTPVPNGFVAIEGVVEAGAVELPLGLARNGELAGPGDLVLVIQMTGPDAGRFEYALAGSTTTGRLVVSGAGPGGGLVHGYRSDETGRAQVVRVPTVERLGPVRLGTVPFDGLIGGVLAVDVTGDVAAGVELDVTGAGPSVGRGAPSGGGVIAIRAQRVAGPLRLVADGRDGASGGGPGGTVLARITQGWERVQISARGGAGGNGPGGPGGTVLTAGRPERTDVRGGTGRPPGATGTLRSAADPAEFSGIAEWAGCLPAVEVAVRAEIPEVPGVEGAVTSWRVAVTNRPQRGTADAVEIVAAPSGPVTAGTRGPAIVSGGAQRLADADGPGGALRWASFRLPGGGRVETVLRATPLLTSGGVAEVGVRVLGRAGSVVVHAGRDPAAGSEDDVRVIPEGCPQTRPEAGGAEPSPAAAVTPPAPECDSRSERGRFPGGAVP